MIVEATGRHVPFNAVDGTAWEDALPLGCGPHPVNVTLSVSELLILRDTHRTLAAEGDCRSVPDWLSEHEFHAIRANYFESLARHLAPDLIGQVGEPPASDDDAGHA